MANFHIHQTIHIHTIKIETLSNSSIFQIGSAGVIKSVCTMAQPRPLASSIETEPLQISTPPKP